MFTGSSQTLNYWATPCSSQTKNLWLLFVSNPPRHCVSFEVTPSQKTQRGPILWCTTSFSFLRPPTWWRPSQKRKTKNTSHTQQKPAKTLSAFFPVFFLGPAARGSRAVLFGGAARDLLTGRRMDFEEVQRWAEGAMAPQSAAPRCWMEQGAGFFWARGGVCNLLH